METAAFADSRRSRFRGIARGLFAGMAALSLACVSASVEEMLRSAKSSLERGENAVAVRDLEAALALARVEPTAPHVLFELHFELGGAYDTYLDLGKEGEALAHFEAAHRLAERELAGAPSYRAATMHALGGLYTRQERYAEARPLLEGALDLNVERYGPRAATEGDVASWLMSVYAALGEKEKLESLRLARRHPGVYAFGKGARKPRTFSPDELSVEPNARTTGGAPAYLHHDPANGPLTVALGKAEVGARDATLEATTEIVASAFRAWEGSIRRIVPAFRFEIAEAHADPDIEVVWARRPRLYLPARGEIFHALDRGVRSRVTVSPQPLPSADAKLHLGELRAHAMHAIGTALGLTDCWPCDSIMSLDWLRSRAFVPTSLDLRSYEALLARDVTLPAVSGALAQAELPEGVFADLPMINTGDALDIVINLAADSERALVVTLDTGAVDTILTPLYARALGMSVRDAKTTANRRATSLGRDLEIWVANRSGPGSYFEYALLGGEFMAAYVVEIDFGRRSVRFLDPEIHPVGLETARDPDRYVIDLEVVSRRPFAALRLGRGVVNALVDTGAEAPLMTTEEKAVELGVEVDRTAPRRYGVNVLGSSVSTRQPLRGSAIGDLELDDAEIVISLRDESQVRVTRMLKDQSIIGLETLRPYRMRFDYVHGRLGLTPLNERAAVP